MLGMPLLNSLHYAARDDKRREVALLLSQGVPVDDRDRQEFTPLLIAALHGRCEVASLLLSKGADVEARDDRGLPPLHAAAFNGHCGVATLLLSHGAAVDGKDARGNTVLSRAARSGHCKMVALLLRKGADVDAKNDYGATPLHQAALFGHSEVAALLLSHGADPRLVKLHERSPMSCALISDNTTMVELLASYSQKSRPKPTTTAAEVQQAVADITELFALHCPLCKERKTVVFGEEPMALWCKTCDCHFCGYCERDCWNAQWTRDHLAATHQSWKGLSLGLSVSQERWYYYRFHHLRESFVEYVDKLSIEVTVEIGERFPEPEFPNQSVRRG